MQGHKTHLPHTPEETESERARTLAWLERARQIRLLQHSPPRGSLLEDYAILGVIPSNGKRNGKVVNWE